MWFLLNLHLCDVKEALVSWICHFFNLNNWFSVISELQECLKRIWLPMYLLVFVEFREILLFKIVIIISHIHSSPPNSKFLPEILSWGLLRIIYIVTHTSISCTTKCNPWMALFSLGNSLKLSGARSGVLVECSRIGHC